MCNSLIPHFQWRCAMVSSQDMCMCVRMCVFAHMCISVINGKKFRAAQQEEYKDLFFSVSIGSSWASLLFFS